MLNKYEFQRVQSINKGPLFGKRHAQAIILFFCILAAYCCRVCLNVAILGMTDASIHNGTIQTFSWDKPTQGIVLGAAAWGDLTMQFPAGFMVCKYGGKMSIIATTIVLGICSILTPLFGYLGDWKGVFIIRLISGLFGSFTFPAVHTLLGKWAPVTERNRLGNFIYSSVTIASIFSMPVTAYIASSPLGWPWIFYIYGISSILMGLLWVLYGADSPALSKNISQEERTYIEKSLGTESSDLKLSNTPWIAILTSKPVWALILTQTGALYGYTVMITETPTFFKVALGIDLQESGLLAALPFIAALITTIIASFTADFIAHRGYMRLTTIRKVANTMGTWGPAFALIALMYVPFENVSTAVSFVVLILALDALVTSGFVLNHIDLSPNYAGFVVSIGLTVADVFCVFAPIINGYILRDPSDLTQWWYVFLITASSYFIGNVFFLIFGSAEEQPWNSLNDKFINKEEDDDGVEVAAMLRNDDEKKKQIRIIPKEKLDT